MRFRVLGGFALLALLVGQAALANIPMPGLAPKMYANPGPASSIAVDSQGNIVEGRTGADLMGIVVKIGRDGAQLWEHDFSTGSGRPAVGVDSHDNILAAPMFDGALYVLDSGGHLAGSSVIPGVSPTVRDIFVTPSDGVLVASTVADSPAGQISKIDSLGRGLWARTPGIVMMDSYVGTTGTPDGGVILTSGSGTVKFDVDGNVVWSSQRGGRGVAADGMGDVYVSYDYLTKLSGATGQQMWTANEYGNKVRVFNGVPVLLHAYAIGVGPFPQSYASTMEVSALDPSTGHWVWGFKHISNIGGTGNLVDFYVRPGYIAFSNAATDSALYTGSWLAAVCDSAANPPSTLYSLARVCVFTPV